MKTITNQISQAVLKEADDFNKFRHDIKCYLKECGRSYDKFTVTDDDSFIGYISEKLVAEYIEQNYSDKGITVSPWASNFDLKKIGAILKSESKDVNDIKYVEEYFYDKYDLKVSYGEREMLFDVKCAATLKTPVYNWSFFYPVVQAEKEGDVYIIVGYYIKKSNEISDFKEFILCGYMSKSEIRKCPKISKGQKSEHKTESQIDNYKTLIKNYKNLDYLMKAFIS